MKKLIMSLSILAIGLVGCSGEESTEEIVLRTYNADEYYNEYGTYPTLEINYNQFQSAQWSDDLCVITVDKTTYWCSNGSVPLGFGDRNEERNFPIDQKIMLISGTIEYDVSLD